MVQNQQKDSWGWLKGIQNIGLFSRGSTLTYYIVPQADVDVLISRGEETRQKTFKQDLMYQAEVYEI